MFLLGLALGFYLLSLLGTILLRAYWRRRTGRTFAIPYDRLPIGIALVLLATAAGILAGGNEDMANDFAIMAYYLLVLGVLLQMASYIRSQRAGKRAEDEEHHDERG